MPYVLTEAFFVAYLVGWAVRFATDGLVWCAIGAAYIAACIVYLCFFCGDHLGKVCFTFDRRVTAVPGRPMTAAAPMTAESLIG